MASLSQPPRSDKHSLSQHKITIKMSYQKQGAFTPPRQALKPPGMSNTPPQQSPLSSYQQNAPLHYGNEYQAQQQLQQPQIQSSQPSSYYFQGAGHPSYPNTPQYYGSPAMSMYGTPPFQNSPSQMYYSAPGSYQQQNGQMGFNTLVDEVATPQQPPMRAPKPPPPRAPELRKQSIKGDPNNHFEKTSDSLMDLFKFGDYDEYGLPVFNGAKSNSSTRSINRQQLPPPPPVLQQQGLPPPIQGAKTPVNLSRPSSIPNLSASPQTYAAPVPPAVFPKPVLDTKPSPPRVSPKPAFNQPPPQQLYQQQPQPQSPFMSPSQVKARNLAAPFQPSGLHRSTTDPDLQNKAQAPASGQAFDNMNGPAEILNNYQYTEDEIKEQQVRHDKLQQLQQIVNAEPANNDGMDWREIYMGLQNSYKELYLANQFDEEGSDPNGAMSRGNRISLHKFIVRNRDPLRSGNKQQEQDLEKAANFLETIFAESEDGLSIRAAPEKEREIQRNVDILQKAMDILKISVRIYIEKAGVFKTIMLHSFMSVKQSTENIKEKAFLEASDDWTIFEMDMNVGIERPLRDYEIMTDVVKTWKPYSVHALLIKKFTNKRTVTYQGARDYYPKISGEIYVEVKDGKWQKKYMEVKADGLFISKNEFRIDEILICPFSLYDVYTLVPEVMEKTPTKLCFAMRLQQPGGLETGTLPYLIRFCVDTLDKLKAWVLSIRHRRSRFIVRNFSDKQKESFKAGEARPNRAVSEVMKSSRMIQ